MNAARYLWSHPYGRLAIVCPLVGLAVIVVIAVTRQWHYISYVFWVGGLLVVPGRRQVDRALQTTTPRRPISAGRNSGSRNFRSSDGA
jgi:hypothetical protein